MPFPQEGEKESVKRARISGKQSNPKRVKIANSRTFPLKTFLRAKNTSLEGAPKGAPVKNFKDPYYEIMVVAHL